MYGYLSCPECGVAVQAARLVGAEHDCSAERRIAHQMLKGRVGIERREHDLAGWPETPRGRFAAFLARRPRADARDRRKGELALPWPPRRGIIGGRPAVVLKVAWPGFGGM